MSDGVVCCEASFSLFFFFPAPGLKAKQLSDEPIVCVVVRVKLRSSEVSASSMEILIEVRLVECYM